MKQNYLNRLLNDSDFLQRRIDEFKNERTLLETKNDPLEQGGHLQKAEHNLNFVKDILNMQYPDWCITGCYYAVYHAALALILAKGYASKNHEATLCVLIKEYYKKGIDAQEIETMHEFFLTYQDVLTYVESKQTREKATYSTERHFEPETIKALRLKAILFVNKAREILEK